MNLQEFRNDLDLVEKAVRDNPDALAIVDSVRSVCELYLRIGAVNQDSIVEDLRGLLDTKLSEVNNKKVL